MSKLEAFVTAHKIELVAAAACMLITAGAYFLIISPATLQSSKVNAQRKKLENCRTEAKQLAQKRKELTDEANRVTDEIAKSQLQLQPYSVINHRVALMNSIASQLDVKVDQVELGAVVDLERYRIAPIRMTGRCGFKQFCLMLQKLRSTFPDTAITHMNIAGTGYLKDAPAIFNLHIVWYAAPTQTALIE